MERSIRLQTDSVIRPAIFMFLHLKKDFKNVSKSFTLLSRQYENHFKYSVIIYKAEMHFQL